MLKTMARALAQSSGYEIMTLARAQGEQRCVANILREERIDLVVDVGANVGQFARWIRRAGYQGRILSFEPLSAAHQQLTTTAKKDPLWSVAPRMALGAEDGNLEIHVAGNSASSSVLPMLRAHQDAAPDSAYVGCESVEVHRLDEVCPITAENHPMLKVDVQGYEKAVLDGAPFLLQRCRAIIVEMSLTPLYKGQVLAMDIWNYLTDIGFQPWYFNPGFRDPRSGRMLQVDGVFVRG
jgi:FkbM family methyltransferase